MNSVPWEGLVRGDTIAARWAAFGLSADATLAKSRLVSLAAQQLSDVHVEAIQPPVVCFVPGRIEVLGKHTDYAGGRSLLVAVDRGFCLVATPRSDRRIRVFSADESVPAEFGFLPDLTPRIGHWSNYPMTVARRLARNFPGELRGADIAFASDLPRSAGMSSSSALMIATYLALATVNGLSQRAEYSANISDRIDLAGYLATIENGMTFGSLTGDRGVGTFGGSEDHTAILFGRPGEIVQYSYCPVRFERSIAVTSDLVFAIAQSGILADKTGNAMEQYNRVSLLARAVVDVWRQATGRQDPHLAAIIASSPDAAAQLRGVLKAAHHADFTPDLLLRRAEQFYEESEQIIPAVPNSLDEQSLARFGELVDRSQSLGAQMLENQTAETIWLAAHARRNGASAASAFGAGFGGSVWALVPEAEVDSFLERWRADYRHAFPAAFARSSFFATHPGPAAFVDHVHDVSV